jgi:hypothetical protein
MRPLAAAEYILGPDSGFVTGARTRSARCLGVGPLRRNGRGPRGARALPASKPISHIADIAPQPES